MNTQLETGLIILDLGVKILIITSIKQEIEQGCQ